MTNVLKVGDIVRHLSNPCYDNNVYNISKIVSFNDYYASVNNEPICSIKILKFVYATYVGPYEYNYKVCNHELHNQCRCDKLLDDIGKTIGVYQVNVTKLSELDQLILLSTVDKGI